MNSTHIPLMYAALPTAFDPISIPTDDTAAVVLLVDMAPREWDEKRTHALPFSFADARALADGLGRAVAELEAREQGRRDTELRHCDLPSCAIEADEDGCGR